MRGKDVYLSTVWLILGILMLCFALACLLMGIPWVAAVMLALFGVGCILAWVNIWIVMVDEQTFIKSDVLGRKRTLHFDDICGYQSVYRNGNWLLLDSCQIYVGDFVSPRFRQAVQACLNAKGKKDYFLNDKTLTGNCWRGKGNIKWLLLLFGIYMISFIALSILVRNVIPVVIMLLFGLLIFALWNKSRKLIATFTLTEDGVRTMSRSAFMQRSATWEEVSLIQIASIASYPRGREYIYDIVFVFVKGTENALLHCQEAETSASITSNPNRIPISMNYQTRPVVLRIAEQKGIPVDCLPSAKAYYET